MGACLLCKKCGQAFGTESHVRSHFVKCKVSLDSLQATDRACKIALRLIATNEVLVYNKATDNPVLQKMVVSEAVKNEWTFPPMWAVRPYSGKSFGQSFVKIYEIDIHPMVIQLSLIHI